MWFNEAHLTDLEQTDVAIRLLNSGDNPTYRWKISPNQKQVALVMSEASSGIVPIEKIEVRSLTDPTSWLPLKDYLPLLTELRPKLFQPAQNLANHPIEGFPARVCGQA